MPDPSRLPEGHDGLPYDEAKIHSDRKRAFLEAYLRVWQEDVGKRGGFRPSLDIFDLYAGTGMVLEKENWSRIWDGTAILAAKTLNEYQTEMECHLVLNTWTDNEDALHVQRSALEQRVNRKYHQGPRRKLAIFSEQLPDGLDAILAYQLERARYPNLWILDPYKATVVPWRMVETIANRVGEYRTKKDKIQKRRPELFIHFMTSTLQRIVKDVDAVCSVLGWEHSQWIEYRKGIEEIGGNVTEALVSAYHNNLLRLYGKDPWVVRVPGKKGNTVSFIFLAVEHAAAWHSVRTKTMPAYEGWVLEKHEPREAEILLLNKIRELKEKGQTTLFDHEQMK